MWAGDFNWHHPLWDEDRNYHLFTAENLRKAQELIELQTRYRMVQVLPKGVPTLIASNSGNYTRPDNIFINEALVHTLITCAANAEKRPAKTDHIPITTTLGIQAPTTTTDTRRNYSKVDWEAFKKTLMYKLRAPAKPKEIGSAGELMRRLNTVCEAIKESVEEHVPETKKYPGTKRWWSDECTIARRRLNSIGTRAFRK